MTTRKLGWVFLLTLAVGVWLPACVVGFVQMGQEKTMLREFCKEQLGSEIFQDPDDVGRSEYRAIYDLLNDAVQESIDQDDSAAETLMMIDTILLEFESWSHALWNRFDDASSKRSSR